MPARGGFGGQAAWSAALFGVSPIEIPAHGQVTEPSVAQTQGKELGAKSPPSRKAQQGCQ